MIGPIVNSCSVLVGGVLGGALGEKIPEKYRIALPLTFGVAAMGIGISLVTRLEVLPAVIFSLVFGAIIGELFNLEKNIGTVAHASQTMIAKYIPVKTGSGLSHEEFIEKYVAIIVIFVASATGIFGAMNEGITGDPSILFAKSILDFLTAIIFAVILGVSVAAIAIPQFVVQFLMFFLGQQITDIVTPTMVGDFSALGGIIICVAGFRIA